MCRMADPYCACAYGLEGRNHVLNWDENGGESTAATGIHQTRPGFTYEWGEERSREARLQRQRYKRRS